MTKDVRRALRVLAEMITLERSECKSHSVLLIKNVDDGAALEAVAVYLVSAIAQSIEANLTIREALFDEETFERDLHDDVVAVIGEEEADSDFKVTMRDPWMWEGISHLLIHLSQENEGFHPSGQVLVKTSIKHDVHDHGLDVITIYLAESLGISAGECKAYFDDPARAISDASRTLSEVDSNKRDIEIRAAVNQLRSGLESEAQEMIAGSFWKDERTYFPFVCCDEAHARDWNRNRKSLHKLAIPVSRKILIPLAMADARDTFDRICELMRCYAVLGKE